MGAMPPRCCKQTGQVPPLPPVVPPPMTSYIYITIAELQIVLTRQLDISATEESGRDYRNRGIFYACADNGYQALLSAHTIKSLGKTGRVVLHSTESWHSGAETKTSPLCEFDQILLSSLHLAYNIAQ